MAARPSMVLRAPAPEPLRGDRAAVTRAWLDISAPGERPEVSGRGWGRRAGSAAPTVHRPYATYCIAVTNDCFVRLRAPCRAAPVSTTLVRSITASSAGSNGAASFAATATATTSSSGSQRWSATRRRRSKPGRVYRQFVSAGAEMPRRCDLEGGGLRRSAGGWQVVQARARGRERWAHDEWPWAASRLRGSA